MTMESLVQIQAAGVTTRQEEKMDPDGLLMVRITRVGAILFPFFGLSAHLTQIRNLRLPKKTTRQALVAIIIILGDESVGLLKMAVVPLDGSTEEALKGELQD